MTAPGPDPTLGPAVLTVKEVALLLRVHPSTVRRYAAAGDLPFVRMGSKIMILKAPLDRILCLASTSPS